MILNMKFKVLMAMKTPMVGFWVVTPYKPVTWVPTYCTHVYGPVMLVPTTVSEL